MKNAWMNLQNENKIGTELDELNKWLNFEMENEMEKR